jgi:hypothetical protein
MVRPARLICLKPPINPSICPHSTLYKWRGITILRTGHRSKGSKMEQEKYYIMLPSFDLKCIISSPSCSRKLLPSLWSIISCFALPLSPLPPFLRQSMAVRLKQPSNGKMGTTGWTLGRACHSLLNQATCLHLLLYVLDDDHTLLYNFLLST